MRVYDYFISGLSIRYNSARRICLKKYAPVDSSNARNQTIFMLMLDTGLRMGELINLKMDDIHMNEGLLKVIGKGKKERIVPMGSNAQRALQRYLFRYRPKPFSTSIDYVFLSQVGKPLTDNSVKLIFSRLAKRSGVARLHAHLCRHTFATRFLINGGDVFTLQQILGHSTLEMVRHYVNLAANHVAIQHQKFSPLDRLSLRK
jgi:site-specific recombinase XerD